MGSRTWISSGFHCRPNRSVSTNSTPYYRAIWFGAIGTLVGTTHGKKEYYSSDGSVRRLHVTHSDDKLIQKYGLILQSKFADFSFAGAECTFLCVRVK